MLKRESGKEKEREKLQTSVPLSDLLFQAKEEKIETKIKRGKDNFLLPVVFFFKLHSCLEIS